MYAPRKLWRPLLLLVVPGATAGLELLHPDASLRLLMDDPAMLQTWLVVHVLQLILFPVLGLAGYMLVAGAHGLPAAAARLAMAGFAVFYGAYDALAGIGTGLILQFGQRVAGPQQAAVLQTAQSLFSSVEMGAYAWIGVLGAFCWVAGLLLAGVALAQPRWRGAATATSILAAAVVTLGAALVWRPLGFIGVGLTGVALLIGCAGARISPGILALLAISALALKIGHPAPYGTIAFISFALAAGWLLLAERRSPLAAADRAGQLTPPAA